MTARARLNDFLRTSFRSLWSLELLLLMSADRTRAYARSELVEILRASEVIVDLAIGQLAVAGLVAPDGHGSFRYAPASADFDDLVEQARALYKSAPTTVRRIIIHGQQGGIAAFADAFRLRGD